MLRSLNTILSSTILARDGKLGHVRDFLLDDRSWTVRYLVVETGSWLSSRRVLVAPSAARQPDWEKRTVPVDLTMDQVRNSPDIDTDKPVSLQHEILMSQYYGWPAYWSLEPMMAPLPPPVAPEPSGPEGDPHLRSFREVSGYEVHATDGEIGHVADLIMEDSNWFLRYLVVSTGNWFSGQQLLLSTRSARSISWSRRRVVLTQSREDM